VSRSSIPLAAGGTVTGAPAAIIILVILALLIIGVVSVIKYLGRKAKNL
jgi:uncharacterized membrane protein